MFESALNSVGLLDPDTEQQRFLEHTLRNLLPKKVNLGAGQPPVLSAVYRVDRLPAGRLADCLDAVDATLGKSYEKVQGPDWRTSKLNEMEEPTLTYVILTCDGAFVGFLSTKLVIDGDLSVLYLYEIHILEQFRGIGLGSKFLRAFDAVPDSLNCNMRYLDRFGPCDGCALTVFSSNTGAYRLYRRNKYVLAKHSPRNRKTPEGIEKPDYYILIRYSAAH